MAHAFGVIGDRYTSSLAQQRSACGVPDTSPIQPLAPHAHAEGLYWRREYLDLLARHVALIAEREQSVPPVAIATPAPVLPISFSAVAARAVPIPATNPAPPTVEVEVEVRADASVQDQAAQSDDATTESQETAVDHDFNELEVAIEVEGTETAEPTKEQEQADAWTEAQGGRRKNKKDGKVHGKRSSQDRSEGTKTNVGALKYNGKPGMSGGSIPVSRSSHVRELQKPAPCHNHYLCKSFASRHIVTTADPDSGTRVQKFGLQIWS